MKRNLILSGGVAHDFARTSQTLSGVLGRDIHYMDIPDMMVEIGLKSMGTPDVIVGALNELSASNRESRLAEVTEDAGRVLGRSPGSFEDFARTNAEAWNG